MNDNLETIELSSEELEIFFNLLNQINENLTTEETELPIEETEYYQLKELNEKLQPFYDEKIDLIENPPEDIQHEQTELYQLELLNEKLATLDTKNPESQVAQLEHLNESLTALNTNFQAYQEYHYSSNQLYQLNNLLVYPAAIIYICYRLLKKFM